MKQKVDPMVKAMMLQIKKSSAKETESTILTVYLSFALLTARDVFGFGKERLARFASALIENLDSYDKGFISVGDALQTIKDETGFDLLELQLTNEKTAEKAKKAFDMYLDFQEDRARRQEKARAKKC